MVSFWKALLNYSRSAVMVPSDKMNDVINVVYTSLTLGKTVCLFQSTFSNSFITSSVHTFAFGKIKTYGTLFPHISFIT